MRIPVEKPQYWVLKTTAGATGISYWREFKKERVVAIGWQDISVKLKEVSDTQLRRIAAKVYPSQNANYITRQIKTFANVWKDGDRVIICRGYAPNQITDVELFGIAEIVGDDLTYDTSSVWWKFKRKAKIHPIEKKIPKSVFEQTLDKHSLLKTIHRIDEEHFNQFVIKLLESGVQVNTNVIVQSFLQAPLVAIDNYGELKQPRRVVLTIQRVIRDGKVGSELKALYQFKCQVCGTSIESSDGKHYAEVHHLKPVGSPHYGQDGKPNAIVVCPQHHAMFDLAVIAINPQTMKIEHWNPKAMEHGVKLTLKHALDPKSLKYHYEKLFHQNS